MKLNEIMEEIDLLVPNAFDEGRKLRWINQAQRQLYHDYPTLVTKKEIPLSAGQKTFSLPADCQQPRIETLLVGEWEYVYEEIEEHPEYRTFTIIDNQVNIYPIPSQSTTVNLYYKPTAVDLTVAELDSVPSFPEDFHELLVFGGAYRVAQRIQDYKLSAELEGRYQVLAREAAKRVTKPKRKTTVIQRGWS